MLAIWGVVTTSCRSGRDDDPGTGIATLRLRIELEIPGQSTRGDSDPANDGERMHTLRIIIVDGDGYVEHNSVWDLRANPAIAVTGKEYRVKANDLKTVVLVANEGSTILRKPDGSSITATDYLRGLSAAAGVHVDIDDLQKMIMKRNDNSIANGSLPLPLAMSAIHSYYIGGEDLYEANFLVHRAAVKYLFRFNNHTDHAFTLQNVRITNVTQGQFFFPNAVFTRPDQSEFSSYTTPDNKAENLTLTADTEIPAKSIAEYGPVYFPEGICTDAKNPYAVGFTIQNVTSDMYTLTMNDSGKTPMTELARNTYIIVNVNMTMNSFTLNYTICPWTSLNIDIPSFR